MILTKRSHSQLFPTSFFFFSFYFFLWIFEINEVDGISPALQCCHNWHFYFFGGQPFMIWRGQWKRQKYYKKLVSSWYFNYSYSNPNFGEQTDRYCSIWDHCAYLSNSEVSSCSSSSFFLRAESVLSRRDPGTWNKSSSSSWRAPPRSTGSSNSFSASAITTWDAGSCIPSSKKCELCHGKSYLKIFVIVIPKEGLAGGAPVPPILLWIWHQLLPANPSFGMTTTKILRQIFSWHSLCVMFVYLLVLFQLFETNSVVQMYSKSATYSSM